MTLKEVLRVLEPATSIEIARLYDEDECYYCGLLVNLTYCDIKGLLEQRVSRIRMKNEEHGYCVVIEIS